MNITLKRALIAGVLLVFTQSLVWVVSGRTRLVSAVALFDIELSARLAEELPQLRGRAYDYLVLSDEVFQLMSPAEVDRYKNAFSSYSPGKVLSGAEWSQVLDDVGPEERWDIITTRTDCVNVTPNFNTPLVAKVECTDGCLDTAWHGHAHWFAFVLGKWVHLHRTGEWVS